MDKFKIIINGVEKDVDGIFYLYNMKYFFAYTEKKLDENDYVIFNLVQVGKEIKNTPDGPLDTGYMIGMEISDVEEWKSVQESITKIVDDKKNGTQSEDIQYLPQDMMSTLKVMSSKIFRLTKSVTEQIFKINLSSENPVSVEINQNNIIADSQFTPTSQNLLELEQQKSPLEIENENVNIVENNQQSVEVIDNLGLNNNLYNNNIDSPQNDVIIDYRSKFFEEQEKNKQLEEQIRILNEKIENIKLLIG